MKDLLDLKDLLIHDVQAIGDEYIKRCLARNTTHDRLELKCPPS
jgi:hypothetical protein